MRITGEGHQEVEGMAGIIMEVGRESTGRSI